jgi:riboflavin biosynthesis pyrimidine reductase
VRVRRLHPDPSDEVDSLDHYPVGGDERAHLRVNMVSSVDGAAAVEGRVGMLSGGADQVLLHELRSLCDVLLVGAGTVRAEGYGRLDVADDLRSRRLDRGQAPVPRLAVLTRGIDLDLTAPVFTDASEPPLLLTTRSAPDDRVREAAKVAEVLVVGQHQVDLRAARDELAARGLPRILSEGGPRVLAELFDADLVDELCLAVAPLVTCGDDLRITAGPRLATPEHLGLANVLERDQYLFLRYTRR